MSDIGFPEALADAVATQWLTSNFKFYGESQKAALADTLINFNHMLNNPPIDQLDEILEDK